MSRFSIVLSTLAFGLNILVCNACFCEEDKGAKNVAASKDEVADPKETEDKKLTEEFNKLKELLLENLPNMEKQLEEAFGYPIKLKMVVESNQDAKVSGEKLNKMLKDVEVKLEETEEIGK